jgi:hypothetical protein
MSSLMRLPRKSAKQIVSDAARKLIARLDRGDVTLFELINRRVYFTGGNAEGGTIDAVRIYYQLEALETICKEMEWTELKQLIRTALTPGQTAIDDKSRRL